MRSTFSSHPHGPAARNPKAEAAPIDRDLIANLSDQNILDMEADELLRVINASHHPWRSQQVPGQFERADVATLRRMAFMARLCCRNALNREAGEEPDVRTDDSGIWMYGAG
ncbi:hypothetical protein Mal4_29760 [Maioricimonas rarisocia]|uniref:Uncharacterized protein n=1 Tax=Maioricimonas rarisocia TaxID=2528026 RepID=A0A517Z852_9PLAN|nr:hypothetical protein [Maioricimonas rarisocia]QDU38646.1 hypothetical protein Mal4_29760 [Maioricimonas rarisocia]